ncbi:MAG: M3 family oligoendopeptidase [Planctomycetota bacterium]
MTTLAPHSPDTSFVPADIDAASWQALAPLVDALRERDVSTHAELERWLLDRSELGAAASEAQANLYITMTCFTEDEAAQSAYTRFVEETAPELTKAAFSLDRRQAELFELLGSPGHRYTVLDRDTRADVELFREENVPIQTELEKLSQKYDQTVGGMTVEFDGAERTLPQMGVYQERTDREIREGAWRAVADRRLADRDAIDGLFDEMIAKRHKLAQNAGFKQYTGYAFRSKHRFDYTPEHCFAFHDAIERHVVPLMRELDRSRASALGLSSLRPWDITVDPKGRDPLTPFDGGVELIAKSRACFDELDPELAGLFRSLGDGSTAQGPRDGACLDLDSRKGKSSGGYQYDRDRARRSFIFMNAAGLHRDVETMVHEAGHAFHSMLCRPEPLLHYRHSPIEFAEVASMSMELLTMPHWSAFYPDQADADRARLRQLEGIVSVLPWVATIDCFQHRLYAEPEHTRTRRTEIWLEIDERFGHSLDWSGLDAQRESVWQRQGHLFGVPFYYIEYGIAQLGALGLWLISLEQGSAAALERYKAALKLGGSRPLPELFEAAGLPFDFGDETVGRLTERLESELSKLPD